MEFPHYFADANADFTDATFIIMGVPYDKTSSFRCGASQGPATIRQASWNFETHDLRTHIDLSNISIHDFGDLTVKNTSPATMIKKVNETTTHILENHKFPLLLGGEHTATIGAVQAFPKNITLLALDAHLDYRDQYNEEQYNHACVIRRLAEHVNIENIIVVGVRSAEKEEYDDAKKHNLYFIDAFTIQKIGITEVLHTLEKKIGTNPLYLTLDMDVVDPAYAPGVSTPEPFGLQPFEILACIERVSPQLIGFDLVEVCPPYDNGETSLLAAKLVRSTIGIVWKKKTNK